MAAPTFIEATSLVEEGLRKAGVSSPTSEELDIALNLWMQEIKEDIE